VITLTARESFTFTHALMSPGAPNERLGAAAQRRQELIAE
jgi:uncharacterized protein (DUF1778 family)